MPTVNEYEELLKGEPAVNNSGNEYADLLAEQGKEQKTSIKQSMFVAAQGNPDQKARAMELSKKMNLPVNLVERNFDKLEKKSLVDQTDYDDLIQSSPGLAKWLEDPNNATLAKDDLDNLKGIESKVKEYTMMGTVSDLLGKGLSQASASAARIPGFLVDQVIKKKTFGLFGKGDIGVDDQIPEYFQKKADEIRPPVLDINVLQSIKKGNYTDAGKGLAAQFVVNAPNQAILIGAYYFGGPAAGSLIAGGSSAAQKFSENVKQGPLEPGQEPGLMGSGAEKRGALPSAILTGSIEAGFENLGTFGILKSWEKTIANQYGKEVSKETMKAFSKQYIASIAGEANEEALTSAAQDLTDYLTGVNPEALNGMAERAINAGLVGGFSGGVMTAPSGIAIGVDYAAKSRKTTIAKEFYTALGATLEATKLRKRMPEAQKNLVEQITKDSAIENIYISTEAVEKFFQSKNESPVKIMQDLGVSEAFSEAKLTGADVKIPLATWVNNFVGTEFYEGLANDVKFNQGELSFNELQQEKEKVKADLEAQAAEVSAVDQFSESGQMVRENVANQLKAINQDPKQAELYRGFEVIGKRAGIDPLELFNKYALRIGTGQGDVFQEAETLNQTPADLAMKAYMQERGITELSQEEQTFFQQAQDEARIQRAREMGFDTERTVFHGGPAGITEFKTNPKGANKYLEGVYFTTSKNDASRYQSMAGQDAQLYPSFIRGKLLQLDDYQGVLNLIDQLGLPAPKKRSKFKYNPEMNSMMALRESVEKSGVPTKQVDAEIKRILQDAGYSGVETKNDLVISVFDPKDIRAVNAAFEVSDSANIYFQGKKEAKKPKKATKVKKQIEADLIAANKLGEGEKLNLDFYEGQYVRENPSQEDTGVIIKGPRAARAKKQGFDLENAWYHGSKANISAFSNDTLGGSTGAGSARLAHFFASSPQTASDYAEASTDALTLRSNRMEAEAQREFDDLSKRMKDKYGKDWKKKLSDSEKKSFDEVEAKRIEAIKQFELASEATPAQLDFEKYQIDLDKSTLKTLKKDLRTKKYLEQNKQTREMLSYLNSLVDNTTFQPVGGAVEIVNNETGEKIPNKYLSKEGAPNYRHFDTEASIRDRIAKIEAKLERNTPENLKKEIKDFEQAIKEREENYLQKLQGIAGQTVYKTVLALQNPLIVDFKGAEYREVTYRQILETAQKYGYDGVIFQNTYDPAFVGGGAREPDLMDVAAVFEPQNIRSVAAEFRDKSSPDLLAQEGEGGIRGQISFGAGRNVSIDILKTADKSTFLHETGHFYLEVLGDVVDQVRKTNAADLTDSQKQLIDDYETLLKWFGVENRQGIKTEQHEQFARGFEAYLMEGKAPTAALRQIFAKFKAWLISVYRQITNLNVELTPEVRGVLDRMLATDDEISAVQLEMNAQPLFEDPEAVGMSKAMAEKYLAAREEARIEAENTLTSKVMKEFEKQSQAEYKARKQAITEEVTKQIEQGPVYRAIDMLKAGSPLPDGTPLKLSRESIEASYGKEFIKKLPKQIFSDTGLHFEIVAQSFGFESGDAFLVQMANAPKKENLIDQTVARRMEMEFPEVYKSGPQFNEEAVKAYHNENRAKMLRMELEHIASNNMPVLKEAIRKVARRVPTEKMVREQARAIVGKKSINELKPYIFQRAEAKAAKQAGELLAKGDFDGAFEAKRKELLNHELFRAAQEAIETVEKSVERFKKITKTSDDETLAKKRDMDLVNAARSILTQFGLGQKVDRSAQSYIEPIRQYDPDTYGVVTALIESATEKVGQFDQIPLNDFLAMSDAVLAIWDIAKEAKQIEIDGKVLAKEEVISELSSRVQELSPPEKRAGYDRAVETWDKVKMGLIGWRAAARRVESWADAMDGDAGPKLFTKYLWNPVSEAVTQYRLAKKEYLQKYLDLVKKIEGGLIFRKIAAPELNGYVFKDKTEILGAMLHMGNESNLSKLLRGRGWGDYNEAGELDTQQWNNFLNRMVRENVLNKDDFDYCQAVWDLLEEMKPMAQKAHKKMYGQYFNEITADAFVTPFGTYRGGYVPAITDPYIAIDQSVREDKEILEKNNNSFMFPTTGRGFTKSRVNNYAAPLEMNVGAIPRHIDKVLRFSMIEPHVKQVGRVLVDRNFRATLDNFDTSVASEMLIPWLQRAAQQRIAMPSKGFGGRAFDAFCKELRNRTGFSTMVFNVVNTLQQFTGFTIAALKVKPKYLRNALWNYVQGPAKMAEDIAEKSDFMKTKLTGQAQEMQGMIDDLLMNPTKYDKVRDFANKHGYFLQSGTQNIVDAITWTGAYEQAIEKGLAEKDAVREADAAVRLTQGSFAPEDISNFEAGTPFQRLFTMFYSYFNMQANLLGTEFIKVARDIGLRKGAGRALYIYAFGFMLPAFLSELLVRASSGSLDEDDDDQYLDDLLAGFFGSQARSATAMIPGFGQAATAGFNMFNGKPYDDRISTSPAISTIESAVSAPASVYKAIQENGNKKKAIRDTLTATSLVTGIPVAPLARPLGYLADVSEGKANPTGPVDLTRGLITGKAGE